MTHQAPSHSRGGLFSVLAVSLLLVASVIAAGQGNSPTQLRRFIDQQVGGIQKLMVPANDADLPQPRLANGSPDPLFQTTEAKRYLGKMLFHDPVRTARIMPEFGGVLATQADRRPAEAVTWARRHRRPARSSTSPRAARGEATPTPTGNFIPRRRPRSDILPILRQTPLFPGDALVDELPTLTDIYGFAVGSPSAGSQACHATPATLLRNRSTRRPGQRRAKCAWRDRSRLQQPPLVRRVRRRAGRVARRPQSVRASGAGKRGSLATRRSPDAGRFQSGRASRTSGADPLSEALPGRVSRGGRPWPGAFQNLLRLLEAVTSHQRRHRLPGDGHLPANRGHTKHALGSVPGRRERRADACAAAWSQIVLHARAGTVAPGATPATAAPCSTSR